ncbi:MAG: peptidoglycan DD-metalloendopeptidase family protein [Oscillospiraceae bacterium]|nr:peptidoglycan DD-metalloendopeptidase family protein [Oscillospiraceae bacterium]
MRKSQKSKIFTLLFVFICVIIYSLCPALTENRANAYSRYSRAELEEKIREINAENLRLDNLIAQTDKDLAQNSEIMALYAEKINAEMLRIDYYHNLLYNCENEIEMREEDISQTKGRILEKENQISANLKEIEALDKKNSENLQDFAQLIVKVYKSGSMGNIAFYDEAGSFADLAIGHKTMDNISRKNLEFMNALLESIREHEQKSQALNGEIEALEQTKLRLEMEYGELNLKKLELEKTAKECKDLNENYNRIYEKYADDALNLEIRKSNYYNKKRINRAEADEFDKKLRALIIQNQSNSELTAGTWQRPLDARFGRITTYFGFDAWRNGQHNGIDIAGDSRNDINRANIYAVRDGTVLVVKNTYISGYSYGKYIVVDHGGGYISLYAHCNDIYVYAGQKVSGGQVIGSVGSTGWSTGPHLHFEIRLNSVPQNPMNFINF